MASLAERFWAKVDRSGGPDACWPWMGATAGSGYRDGKGYGVIAAGRNADGKKRNAYAHRVALALSVGEPADPKMNACHHCDFTLCCNPAHLFWGTQSDNLRDASAKGRSQGPHRTERIERGTARAASKLTDDQVRDIRQRYAAGGVYQRDLAAEFGICRQVVGRIVNNIAWRHV